jgi:hypothetical protein
LSIGSCILYLQFSAFIMRFRFFKMICLLLCILIGAVAVAQKTVTIYVTDKSELTIDGVTVYSDNLAKEVQQRLWRSYMTTGKMLQSIQLMMGDGVPETTRAMVQEAIKTAQSKTLTVLSLHKHKKRFEDISGNKQDRIRKQFPVLFQDNYSLPETIKSE